MGGDPEPEAPRIVSIARAQVLLGDITRREVNNKVRRGELKTVHIGRRVFVLQESIDALINAAIKAAGHELVPAS